MQRTVASRSWVHRQPRPKWGTGFDPELTGRENVYLNGAILGTKLYIARTFDEIVAFAEVDKFLDTPGKALLEQAPFARHLPWLLTCSRTS